jgi:ATP-dependent Lhr-like helicase
LREHLDQLPAPDKVSLSENAERVLAELQGRGASFVADLSRHTQLSPTQVRAALWELARRQMVTNDSFGVVRRGEVPTVEISRDKNGRSSRPVTRRRPLQQAEDRWSLLAWGEPRPEQLAVFQAGLLLNRYGFAAKELAAMDLGMMPWRDLYKVLSRMEMTGEVRRGHFVEGLSGAQFALPEAVASLQAVAEQSEKSPPVILLHSLDPANLYGSGAPFDLPLGGDEPRAFLRRVGNWLAVRAGRPVLLIEQQGRRLTPLADAGRNDVVAAVASLSTLCTGNGKLRSHKLTVDEWNAQPVTKSEGRELLEQAGFVRDYQGMTLYAAWR